MKMSFDFTECMNSPTHILRARFKKNHKTAYFAQSFDTLCPTYMYINKIVKVHMKPKPVTILGIKQCFISKFYLFIVLNHHKT